MVILIINFQSNDENDEVKKLILNLLLTIFSCEKSRVKTKNSELKIQFKDFLIEIFKDKKGKKGKKGKPSFADMMSESEPEEEPEPEPEKPVKSKKKSAFEMLADEMSEEEEIVEKESEIKISDKKSKRNKGKESGVDNRDIAAGDQEDDGPVYFDEEEERRGFEIIYI